MMVISGTQMLSPQNACQQVKDYLSLAYPKLATHSFNNPQKPENNSPNKPTKIRFLLLDRFT
tara:strand:- start:45 stop:230 length:186 start_codon:yes stop_codon:yes gene_type:complete